MILMQNECKRCGYKWTPRVPDVKMCPKCKSLKWQEDKPKKKAKTEAIRVIVENVNKF